MNLYHSPLPDTQLLDIPNKTNPLALTHHLFSLTRNEKHILLYMRNSETEVKWNNRVRVEKWRTMKS